ncbi:MAG: helix-turn-helix transcriptional regulator [Anaerovoracaceae bacterium]|jgi:predicted DNA-binding transcriptional regulator YafY
MITEKLYLLCILSVLQKYSDADHILTTKGIIEKLNAEYDISVDRRTIYRNVGHLVDFGYDISTHEENGMGYYLRERDFETSELRLLADAVFTAEFIPEKEGKTLIRKLQKLGSVHQTKPLNRLSAIKVNRKSPNKEIFYNIEVLDEAITKERCVEFEYVMFDMSLKQVPKREEKYVVSPYALYWSNNQYYLISNMAPLEGITHFRLDRIKKIVLTGTRAKPLDKSFDLNDYVKKALFMFGGPAETFTIRCDKTILNDVIDRFGDNIIIVDSDESTFTTIIKATSQGMRLWAMHYFDTCRVLAPEWLVQDMRNALQENLKKYI